MGWDAGLFLMAAGMWFPPVLDMAEKYARINSSASVIEHYFAFILGWCYPYTFNVGQVRKVSDRLPQLCFPFQQVLLAGRKQVWCEAGLGKYRQVSGQTV